MMPIRIIKLLICWKGKFASLVVLQEENIGCGSFKHYVIAWREGNNHTFDDVDLLRVLCIFFFFFLKYLLLNTKRVPPPPQAEHVILHNFMIFSGNHSIAYRTLYLCHFWHK